MDLVHGFVLAGGRSLRMGQPKALMLYPGATPMVAVAAAALAPLCDRISVVVKPHQRDGSWPEALHYLVEEQGLPEHPLSGVVTALSQLEPNMCGLFVPCDMPYLGSKALARLVAAGQKGGAGAVAHDGVRLHPLVAFLPQSALERARAGLLAGTSVTHFAAPCTNVHLPPECLRNMNSPSDMEQ